MAVDVDAAIKSFLHEWPDAEFGPAHIVLSDGNIEPPHIYWCLGLIAGELQRRGEPHTEPTTDQEREGVADVLSGKLDIYREQPADEMRATETFLRGLLMPCECGCGQLSPGGMMEAVHPEDYRYSER